jgi:CspA family cold shock protein
VVPHSQCASDESQQITQQIEVLAMLSSEEIESGLLVTHKNTGLRYSVVDFSDDEVLLSPEQADLQDLTVPQELFQTEFITSERFRGAGGPRSRGRGRSKGRRHGTAAPPQAPSGPRCKGRIKKMVRDRGFGFIRGDDGKEVFFHRSGLNAAAYDGLNEGDVVEYVVQEGPRGARAENVKHAGADGADAAAAN